MSRCRPRIGLGVLVLFLAALPVRASEFTAAATGGVWTWDPQTLYDRTPVRRVAPVVGLRGGFAPNEGLSTELVLLTGTTAFRPASGPEPEASLRATQIEASLLIHFRSFLAAPLYPFVVTGGGVVIYGGEAGETGDYPPGRTHMVFHLGGGVRAPLGERWAARATVRDTFLFDTQGPGAAPIQKAVDRIEWSLSLEAVFPRGGSGRARSG